MTDDDILKKVGSNLRSIRERRNMSAEDIASMLSISPDAVRKYERGDRDPGIARILTARSMLGCSIMTMLSGILDDEQEPTEYNVLSPDASHILHRLATSWQGDIDALIIFAGMLAAMPEQYRREIYMTGTVLKDRLLSNGTLSPSDLPPGISYMESALGSLYEGDKNEK